MAKAFRLPNNQHQEFIFAARQIPKQIRENRLYLPPDSSQVLPQSFN
jgi:hypothetical protein